MSFLEAVLWWSGYSSDTTVDDLLAVTSLEPLDQRSQSHRKAKSMLATHVVSFQGIQAIIAARSSGQLNQVEWKAYQGRGDASTRLYSDGRSPLLRGHILEMHYGNSAHDGQSDSEAVEAVEAVAQKLAPYFAANFSYIG